MKKRKVLKRMGANSKIIKSGNLVSLHQVAKAIEKKQQPANDSTQSELLIHESVTIPLNDPSHDI